MVIRALLVLNLTEVVPIFYGVSGAKHIVGRILTLRKSFTHFGRFDPRSTSPFMFVEYLAYLNPDLDKGS